MTSGGPFSPLDLLDLAIVKAAKLNRRLRQGATTDEIFYEEFFTDDDDRTLGSAGDPRKNVRLEVVSKALVECVPTGSVLDVGCGVGDTLALLSTFKRWKLTGIEYAQSTVSRASQRLGDKAKIYRCSALAMPFPDATFDGFVCIEVLEHIEDDDAALNEIHRVLSPSGYGVVTVPYRYWFPQYLDLIGHHRHYSRDQLLSKLSRAGFEVMRWLPNYPRWHRAADLTYVVARTVSAVLSRISGSKIGPHQVRLPLSSEPLFSAAMRRLEFLRVRDGQVPPESLPTTASCVVRRAR
jgi:SAM-dependent methyltransferase